MQDFPGNSKRAAKARPKVPDEVVRPEVKRIATAQQKKPGLGQKFKSTIIDGNVRISVDYMIKGVIIPAIQDTVIEALQGGVERLIKGDTHTRRYSGGSPAYPSGPRIDYGKMSRPTSGPNPGAERNISRRSRASHNFGELILENRHEATEVIDYMYEVLSRCGEVSLADLYTMTDIKTEFTDHKWGWTNLQGVRPVRMNDGRYRLSLPEPMELK